jgi:PmbA protein
MGPEDKLTAGANLARRSLNELSIEHVVDLAIRRFSSKLAPKPAQQGWFPVVFAPTASRSLAGILLHFCSGPVAIYLEGSYLGKLGETICSRLISVVDDPLRPRGLKSQPFDHDGVAPRRKIIVKNGVFTEYLLNAYYARVLNRDSTGNAVSNDDIRQGVGPSNAYIEPGTSTPESIISDVRQGLYVTRLTSRVLRFGTSFTQAVTGRWIEGGKLTHAIRPAVISAPIKDVFRNIVACGNDLDYDAPLAAPTLLVSRVNVAPLV